MIIRGNKKAVYLCISILAGLGTLGAVGVPTIKSLLATQRDVTIDALKAAIARGDDGIGPLPVTYLSDDEESVADDALMRALWQRLEHGPISQESILNLLRETQLQQQRERDYPRSAQWLADVGGPSPTPATTLQWSPLGPQSALSEWNGSYYEGLDSGRVATIRADPANPKRIFIGAIGGGIWKTEDITISQPVWTPITDSLGTLFIGSFDIDPTNSDVIHVGLGDYWEGNPGGVMVTTRDGGATWSAPIPLTATLNGVQIKSVNTRTVKIDPNDHNNILVASDIGLFRSIDGGVSYALLDLPNTAAYQAGGPDLEGGFSVAYTGLDPGGSGKSTFLVTGNYACPGTFPPSFNQPTLAFFVTTCPGMTTGNGNLGDIWKSTDSGATWTSARVAGILPVGTAPTTPPTSAPLGRINLAAVPGTSDSNSAVVYGVAANQNGSATVALLKSVDGGATWNVIATSITPPTNPITGAFGNDCLTMDIGHGQSQYDLAISVDPADPNNVMIGGNLCGARTVDGGATWQMSAHWLAFGGAEGPLSYAHADWHHSLVTRVGGQPIALAGTDGGIFISYDLFFAARGTDIKWFTANVGLDTHLPYSVGSGDPSFGTAQYVLSGMQDNGTRFRVSETEAYLSDFHKAWNQIQGGDGFGTAVASDSKGSNVTLWGVANGGRVACRGGSNIDCSRATRVVNGAEIRAYFRVSPVLPTGDANGGFAVRYAPLYDDAGSVITNSNFNLWRISTIPGDQAVITRLVTSPPPANPGGYVGCGTTGVRSIRAGGPTASPFTYTINGTPSRVYGLPLSGGCFAVVVEPVNAPNGGSSTVTVLTAATTIKIAGQEVQNTGSITFPRDPTHLGGTDITKTYVVSTIGDFLTLPAANPSTPIPPAVGHVFMTKDGGTTWTPLHGNGTGFDLPNVRTYVVRFDPSDPTDQTLYAATDLGFFRSTDLGQTWTRYGSNLPLVRVQDMFVSLNGSLIRVAMYGRGLWEIYPRADGASGFTGLGDFDKNGIIDYRDLANLANRLTVTPATAETPLYDNEMNLTETGAATTLDDNDLNGLLTKFGGAP